MTPKNGDLTQKQMISEVHIVLLGVKGTDDKGLVGDVHDIKEALRDLASSHNHLKRCFWVLVSFLIGSGVIAGSIVGALNT